jgi:hypothetical protein
MEIGSDITLEMDLFTPENVSKSQINPPNLCPHHDVSKKN